MLNFKSGFFRYWLIVICVSKRFNEYRKQISEFFL
jgi:hypothetical protein